MRPLLRRLGLALAAGLGLPAPLACQAPADTTPIAIRAARLLDPASGRITAPALVVVRGERIAAVGGAPPAGARVVDLGDVTLLPGLIDLHTHLTSDIEPGWQYAAVLEGPADWALRGARNAERTLLAGFTTVRDVGAVGFSDIALARAIDRGLVRGPRVIPAGHAVGITGGHCDATGFAPGILRLGPDDGIADGPDGMLAAVRRQIKYGAKVIKVCATAGVLSFEGPVGAQQTTQAELEAVVAEARRHGLRVAAHAHGTEGIIAAARAGITSIEHGSILTDEAVRVLKEHGTWLVPNLHLVQGIDRAALPPAVRAKMDTVGGLVAASMQRAMKAGVKIAFGTDAGVYPHGDNAKEFAARVAAGMTPLEAIRGATTYAVEVLGVSDRGRVAPGLLADLVAVPGDPLADVRVLQDVRWVMRGGGIVKGQTR